jgi:hypothetical protein
MKNDWEKKEKTCSAYLSSKIFATFGCIALPWVRSNGPTDPLHISCMCSIWKILHFYSSFSLNPSKSAFFHTLTLSLLPKNHMLFIVSKQCACSRRVHIEGHMNRFEYRIKHIFSGVYLCISWTNSLTNNFVSDLVQVIHQ